MSDHATSNPTASEIQLQLISGFAADLVAARDLDDVLWLIVERVISALSLEDCIIYWLPPGGDQLLQRAAYGPKNPMGREIQNPIGIPLGQGIVGTAAMIKSPLRIDNAEEDPRYIIDDQLRKSELCVPIIFEDRVLGVIDSEHTRQGFFTQQHEDFFCTIANITAARLAEMQRNEQLRLFEKKLSASELNLKRLANASLPPQNATASHLAEAQISMMSRMSHEMKTPLNAILGMSQILLEDQHADALAEPLRLINRAAVDLDHTISTLLTGLNTEPDSGEDSSTDLDLNQFLQEILSTANTVYGGTVSLITKDLPSRVNFRSVIVEQILGALLSNAITFSSDNTATLAVSLGDIKESIGICFTVSDNGPGIAPTDLPRVFEPFYKAGDASATSGKGLGLTVAKALAQRIGAELNLIEKTGEGCTVVLLVQAQFWAQEPQGQ